MHINSSIPNLIGGVSQQPELLRLPSHMRSQVNAVCSPARGLDKRPGTTHLGAAQASGAGFYKVLDYGARGVFHLQMQSGAFKVLNSVGWPVQLYNNLGQAIDSWGGWGPYQYLYAPDVETAIKVVKEADTTFIINTTVPVQRLTGAPLLTAYPTMVWVKAGNYGRTYSVSVPGKGTASWLTADGQAAWMSPLADASLIAEQLRIGLANLGVNVTRNGSVLVLPDSPAGVTVEDGQGGSAIALIRGSVRSVAELPSSKAPGGFHVKVEGGDRTGAGDYYLMFFTEDNVWREVRNPMAEFFAPDPNTMPHKLVPYGAGFMIAPISWDTQMCGDAETNPGPSFYGKTINDLFFYQDRLGILAGEEFNLSETGAYYNFYRTTVTDLLDSDPVSGSVTSTTKVSTLRHAVTFGKRLFFFSDKGEFELQSDQALTPKTGTTQQVAEFECSSQVRPLGIGGTLYFPVDRGANSSVYNFFLDGIDSKAEAVDVSAHVPEYIPKSVTHLAASPVNNMLFLLSKEQPTAIFVYQFYVNAQERLQSSWHKWEFGPNVIIRSMDVVGTRLHMLIERFGQGDNGSFCESIELSTPPGEIRLDRRRIVGAGEISVTTEGTPIRSAFAPGFNATKTGTYSVVVIGDGLYVKAGAVFEANAFNTGTVLVIGANLTGCTLAFGRDYEKRASLGRLTVREQAGQGSAGVSRGRTQVGRAWVNYSSAAAFSVEVQKEGYPLQTYPCSTRMLGTGSAIIGAGGLKDGRFGFPILSRNTECEIFLVNKTPFPASFLSLDWEGYHVSRGQHV